MKASLLSAPLEAFRRIDRALGQRSGHRRILVDARTPVNYTVFAPLHRVMAQDPRLSFFFTASEEPERLGEIYREAPGITLIAPSAARRMRFDAYVASDFMWQSLPRGTRRIQTFHGVGGKYGFDAPTTSMRDWDRIFFVNERRLRNFIKAGAIDANSPAIRLVGYPKMDALVNGAWTRAGVHESLGLDSALPTLLYAPTWSPASSLNAVGEELMARLLATGANVIVKLHDRSRDLRPEYSGGIDWVARLESLLRSESSAMRGTSRGVIAPGHDISPYLVAADVMITDHSSAGFEFLLRDRPIVRIDRPSLIRDANIHSDYVELLASVSSSVISVDEAVRAVEEALASPDALGSTRRAVAADIFYRPGGATARAVRNLYEAVDLEPALATAAEEATCRP
ncbi:MAG: CDP-glycerol glycerophosphotransferase family protein [Vicinamibacterales bacterium]